MRVEGWMSEGCGMSRGYLGIPCRSFIASTKPTRFHWKGIIGLIGRKKTNERQGSTKWKAVITLFSLAKRISITFKPGEQVSERSQQYIDSYHASHYIFAPSRLIIPIDLLYTPIHTRQTRRVIQPHHSQKERQYPEKPVLITIQSNPKPHAQA